MKFRSTSCLLVGLLLFQTAGVATAKNSKKAAAANGLHNAVQPDEGKSDAAKSVSSLELDRTAKQNHQAMEAFKNGDYAKAAEISKELLKELESEKNSEFSRSEVLNNLALILSKDGKRAESEVYRQKAAFLRLELHLPKSMPDELVEILPNKEHRSAATEKLKEIVAILNGNDPLFPRASLGTPTEKAWSEAVAQALQEKKEHSIKKELSSLRKATAIAHLLPDSRDRLISTLNLLADALVQVGRPASALAVYEECIGLSDKQGKKETAEYATLLDHAAQTLIVLAEYEKAESYLVESIHIYKKTLGQKSADLAMTLCTLGQLHARKKEEQKSEAELKKALVMMKEVLKADDERISITESHLADFYLQHGKIAEAEKLQEDILNKTRALHGEKSSKTLQAMKNLAACKGLAENYDEAGKLWKECIELSKLLYGEKSPRTLQVIDSYLSMKERSKQAAN